MNETRRTLAVLRFRAIPTRSSENWLTAWDVPETHFDGLLDWLFHERWVGITAAQLVRGLDLPRILPERSVLLSFDGACRTVLENALPILRKYRFPAVTFVPTDLVGQRVATDGLDEMISVCTWDDLYQLDRSEVSVQSQGATHCRFQKLDSAQQEQEAVSSRDAIEQRFGRPVELFAYPYGDAGKDPAAARRILERAGYRAAFLLDGGVNQLPGADRFQLARIAVGPVTELEQVLGA